MSDVWELLRQRLAAGSRPGARQDSARVALAVEGGGMRASISGGMVHALCERGLRDCFDAVYGSSAGSINAAWFASSNPAGVVGWRDPQWPVQAIGLGNLLARRPYVDVARLVEDIYVEQYPLDFASVLAGPVAMHPMATRVRDGSAVDLAPMVESVADLRTAIRASCTLPLAAGAPVALAGETYADAGLAQPVPMATCVEQGATHVLVLRTRDRAYVRPSVPTGWRSTLTRGVLGAAGYGPGVFTAMQARPEISRADGALVEKGQTSGPQGPVAVAAVWPADDLPQPARTERRGDRLEAAFDGGVEAMEQALAAAAL